MHRGARLDGRVVEDSAQLGAERLGEGDVDRQAIPEEGAGAPLGAVDDLVGDHDVRESNLLFHAAAGVDGDNPLPAADAVGLALRENDESVDVGPDIYLAGKDAVSVTMAGQEGDPLASEGAHDYGVAGLAEGRGDVVFSQVGQPFHLVEPASTNHAYGCLRHGDSPLRILGRISSPG